MERINYVYSIQDSEIRIKATNTKICEKLKRLGFKRKFFLGDFKINYINKEHLLEIVLQLIDLGIYFSGSTHGWVPSAFLAEKFSNLKWKEIVWKNKNEYIIRDKQS